GVQALVSKIIESAGVKLIGAGLGQNVSARRRLIVFRGERILVNSDLANRTLRRHGPIREAVDVDLTGSRWPHWWTGECLQGRREFVRAVGEYVELLARHDRLICVAGGLDAQ